jgi:hypothetical protein
MTIVDMVGADHFLSRRRRWIPWADAGLWVVAIAVTVTAPTLLSNESVIAHRVWRSLPGIFDACGSPTLFARLIPPGIVLAGLASTILAHAHGRGLVALRIGGVFLVAVLAFATMQNFVWGQTTCILD